MYPFFARMARNYLAIPVFSARFESIFSIGGDIITKKRNNMIPECFRWIMLLKYWGIVPDIDYLDDNDWEPKEFEGKS